MTPRAKRSAIWAREHLAERYGMQPEVSWLPVKAGRQTDKVIYRCFVWRHMRSNNPFMSLKQIAIETGAMDHQTIWHGIRRAEYWENLLNERLTLLA